MAARIVPDRAALEVAHQLLHVSTPLDVMLQQPALRIGLENMARVHMKRRALFDAKRHQANDSD